MVYYVANEVPSSKMLPLTCHQEENPSWYTIWDAWTQFGACWTLSIPGVEISRDLSWTNHVKKVTSKANRALGFVRRNLSSCPRLVKVQMYQALVRPHLEYAATAWDPYHLNNINSLEMVQRWSARFVTGNYNRTVTRILSDLQWPTLQRRRQDARLYLLYRSIQGNIAVSLPSYITKQTRTTRHTHPQRFLQVRASTQTYQNSFFPRTVRDWNNLPPDILEAPTAALFKTAVTAWMRREDFILHQRTFLFLYILSTLDDCNFSFTSLRDGDSPLQGYLYIYIYIFKIYATNWSKFPKLNM